MIRWVAVIFLGLTVFPFLLPWLQGLGIGRVPGDLRFRLFGRVACLPFGSTVVVSLLAFAIAEFFQ